MRRALISLAVLALGGCCSDPWAAFPRKTMPDLQFSTGGGTHGYDVYVWDCHDADTVRTVVFQYSAEMTCKAPEQQTAACGTPTTFETSIAAEKREPARAGREWR